jgi:FAD/FMN-containing dehydrogenase
MDVSIRTGKGQDVTVSASELDSLRSRLRGPLVTAGEAGYDEARSLWNGMYDRRPAAAVRCAGAADVMQAVRFAARQGLLLSVRGGGHNIAGNAVADGGLLLDLSGMRSVRVDANAQTVRVEAGARLADVDAETQAFGLATPLGINSTTGLAGLTLGGGFGWLSRRWGLTIDNLLSADVVTAEGGLLHASATENPDLFWAIRGGGGNFGVVTSFELQLHPLGPHVLAGLILHPLAAAPETLRFYRDFAERAPDELACWFVLRQAPPLPFLAPEWHGKEILVLAVCYSGPQAEGQMLLEPLRRFGQPLADVVAPAPYAAWQTVLDPLLTPGQRNYWKSHDFRRVDDGLLDVLLDFATRIPDPQTEIAFAQLGGAVGRVPAAATAYTHRDANWVLNVHGRWSEAANDARCIGWARALFDAAAPFATGGAYVNFLTQDEGARVEQAYGSNYSRLLELKNRYDPTNLFRVNVNIRPPISAS